MRGCYNTEIDLYFFKIVKSYSLERSRLSFLVYIVMDISVCILLWTAQTYTFITELYRHNSFFSMIAQLVQEKKEIAFIILERK